jgi:hypothetical protein
MSAPVLYKPPANGEYLQFSADMNQILASVGHAYINVYTDSAGNNVVNDNGGNPIVNRLIYYTMYTYSATDSPGSSALIGTIRIVFSDGSKLEFPDTNKGYWYSLEGSSPMTIKSLT